VLTEASPGRKLLPARDPASYTVAELWLWCRGPAPEVRGDDVDDRQLLGLLRDAELAGSRVGSPTFAQWLGVPDAAR